MQANCPEVMYEENYRGKIDSERQKTTFLFFIISHTLYPIIIIGVTGPRSLIVRKTNWRDLTTSNVTLVKLYKLARFFNSFAPEQKLAK